MTAGVDEAGRGALCGRVYAAICILKKNIDGINDSKKLSPSKRIELYKKIIENSYYAVSYSEVNEINNYGILNATLNAMKRATMQMLKVIDLSLIIVDGPFKIPDIEIKQWAVIKADQKYKNVMAASIIAKVERDMYMKKISMIYRDWGFERHFGYATEKHLKAIREKGIIEGFHRAAFV